MVLTSHPLNWLNSTKNCNPKRSIILSSNFLQLIIRDSTLKVWSQSRARHNFCQNYNKKMIKGSRWLSLSRIKGKCLSPGKYVCVCVYDYVDIGTEFCFVSFVVLDKNNKCRGKRSKMTDQKVECA